MERERTIWFLGWNDENGEYIEVKFGQNEVEKYNRSNGIENEYGKSNWIYHFCINKYGRWAWENMCYLQHIDLINEKEGKYEMFVGLPDIVRILGGDRFIVDENKNILSDYINTDNKNNVIVSEINEEIQERIERKAKKGKRQRSHLLNLGKSCIIIDSDSEYYGEGGIIKDWKDGFYKIELGNKNGIIVNFEREQFKIPHKKINSYGV